MERLIRYPRRTTIGLVLGVWLALPVGGTRATTVIPMSLDTLADYAGQVIVGTVSSRQSYWTTDPRRIETHVVFSDVEYLKGTPAAATNDFHLILPGGTIGTTQMRLAGAPDLKTGERWLLFLLPSYKTYPTVGITHGAFKIETDGETPRVYSATSGPVIGIDATGFVQTDAARANAVDRPLVDERGVRALSPTTTPAGQSALSYAQFLDRLAPVLAASRDHHLTRPAGQPISVQYTAAPLVRAATDSSVVQRSRTHRPPEAAHGQRQRREAPGRPGGGKP